MKLALHVWAGGQCDPLLNFYFSRKIMSFDRTTVSEMCRNVGFPHPKLYLKVILKSSVRLCFSLSIAVPSVTQSSCEVAPLVSVTVSPGHGSHNSLTLC